MPQDACDNAATAPAAHLAAAASLGTWACPLCTLNNAAAAATCDACECSRPFYPRSAAGAATSDADVSGAAGAVAVASDGGGGTAASTGQAAVLVGSGRYLHGEYVVKAGDTVQGVALKHHLKVMPKSELYQQHVEEIKAQYCEIKARHCARNDGCARDIPPSPIPVHTQTPPISLSS
jgi:hypothetical protein